MKVSLPTLYVLAGLGVVGVAWAMTRQGAAAAAGEAAAHAVVDAAEGAIRGTVIGVGEVVGIPETDNDQCTLDLARGDLWAASFSCPAPRYLKAIATGDYGSSGQSGGATGSW